MIPGLIEDLLARRDVAPTSLEEVFHRILRGEADPAQVAGLLVALRSVPPEAQTLATLASVLRQNRVPLHCQVRPLIDTCGTGGDGSGSFNVSTAAALVVAAAGGAVAKHGNRGVSSKTGSADVLEALGLPLELAPANASKVLDAAGFVFLYAPLYHPVMANVMPVRRALALRTHFNLVGPLSNPALAEYQLLGVFAPELTEVMAGALQMLGTGGALVVHCGGLDEIGLHDVTRGHRVTTEGVEPFSLDPRDLGVDRAPVAAIQGGDAETNAGILRSVLAGDPGPCADIVALNAAAVLEVSGLAPSLEAGLARAREVLGDGSAHRVLERVVESTRRMAEAAGS